MHRRLALIIPLLLSLAFALMFNVTASSAAGTQDFKVISHNVAGGSPLHHGLSSAIAIVNTQITDWNPDAVLLEEMCGSNVEQFIASHPGWTVKFTPRANAQGKCTVPSGLKDSAGREQVGEVVATDLPAVDLNAVYLLPHTGDPADHNAYHLTCLDITVAASGSPVRTCVTHLSPAGYDSGQTIRKAQAQAIANNVQGRLNAGWAVVIGGDFNAGPHKEVLNPLYRIKRTTGDLTGPGKFHEADQSDKRWFSAYGCNASVVSYCRSGQDTQGGSGPSNRQYNIDHIFFSKNHTSSTGVSAGVIQATSSDHDLYRGVAAMTF